MKGSAPWRGEIGKLILDVESSVGDDWLFLAARLTSADTLTCSVYLSGEFLAPSLRQGRSS